MLRAGACALLVMLVAASAAAAEPYQVGGGCRHQGGETLARTKHARIFVRSHVRFDGYFGRAAFGCASRSARRVFLEEDEDPFYLSNFRLAGKYAAYQDDECPAACSQELLVVNLRTSAVLRRQVPASLEDLTLHEQVNGLGRVAALELNARGSLAWAVALCDVDAFPCPADQVNEQIWADGHLGRQRLDVGHDIAPDSLKLDGPLAIWTNAGVARVARVD